MNVPNANKKPATVLRSIGLVRWLRRKCCRHQFRLGDQKLTGIQEQERPAENATYAEWMKWHQNRDKEPAHTKRVSWPCAKCGEVFYAHCGLDILNHGKIMPPNEKLSRPAAE